MAGGTRKMKHNHVRVRSTQNQKTKRTDAKLSQADEDARHDPVYPGAGGPPKTCQDITSQ